MVDGRIAAMGAPAEVKQRFGAATLDEVFLGLVRPAGVQTPQSA